MACFTVEYTRHTAAILGSCRIDDDIWLVQKLPGCKFEMEKMNIYTGKWEPVDCKNRNLIEVYDEESEYRKDFSIFSSDGHIYMWLQYRKLLRFNTTTLEWTWIGSGMPTRKNFVNSVVVNNKVYANSENKNLSILSMDTLLNTIEPFNDVTVNGFEVVNLCEMNGLLYIIRVEKCGTRSVYYRDDNTKTCISVTGGVDQRDYLQHHGRCEWLPTYGSFVWSCNNKLYHAIFYQDGKTFIIDCFDMETKCFTPIYRTNKVLWIWEYISSISGTDEKIHVTFETEEQIAVIVIDLKPSLQTLSLLKLVGQTSKENVDSVRNILPFGLRTLFDNFFEAKIFWLDYYSGSDSDDDSDMDNESDMDNDSDMDYDCEEYYS